MTRWSGGADFANGPLDVEHLGQRMIDAPAEVQVRFLLAVMDRDQTELGIALQSMEGRYHDVCDERDRLRAEADGWRSENDRHRSLYVEAVMERDNLRAAIDAERPARLAQLRALVDERDRLRAALDDSWYEDVRPFLDHRPECAVGADYPCDCGLERLFAQVDQLRDPVDGGEALAPAKPTYRPMPPEPEWVNGINEFALAPDLSTRFGYCRPCGVVYPPAETHECPR